MALSIQRKIGETLYCGDVALTLVSADRRNRVALVAIDDRPAVAVSEYEKVPLLGGWFTVVFVHKCPTIAVELDRSITVMRGELLNRPKSPG